MSQRWRYVNVTMVKRYRWRDRDKREKNKFFEERKKRQNDREIMIWVFSMHVYSVFDYPSLCMDIVKH